MKKFLLISLTSLALQSITAQQMPYKATLENTLATEQSITAAGEIDIPSLFTPQGDFTIDLSMLMQSKHQGALEV